MTRIYDAEERIEAWVRTVTSESNADVRWQIPLTKCTKSSYGVGVCSKMLQATLGLSQSAVSKYRHLTVPVIEVMLSEGIVVSGHEAAAINKRRMLLSWFRSLADDEKRALPTFGNALSIKRALKGDLKPLANAITHYELVRDALAEVNQELMNLGVLNPNYVVVKDRAPSRRQPNRDKKTSEKQETQVERYQELAKLPLDSCHDLIAPSDDRPFVQIEQLFAAASNVVASDSGKGNFISAGESLKRYVSTSCSDEKALLVNLLDEFTLSRYKKWLEELVIKKELSPSHGSTLISSTRKAFKRATKIKGLGFTEFFDVTGFDANRVTDQGKPFSKAERTAISNAIQKDVEEIQRRLVPYQRSGCGENPLDDQGALIPGKGNLENARWLFENRLNEKVVNYYNVGTDPAEKAFMSILTNEYRGIHGIYEEWGVLSRVDIDILTPFLLRLAQVTGMNLEPLLTLDIDDYVPNHEATGRACLRYWKERSTGEKEYHLDLFHADLKWLSTKQSKAVKSVFDAVVELSSGIRDDIEPRYRKRLFIHQSKGARTYGEVRPLLAPTTGGGKAAQSTYTGIKNFVERHRLKNDSGEPLKANVARFRPTFVSELIDQGVSIREIQLMLGHSSIQTTINYLDRMDFNRVARSKVEAALKDIHKRVFATDKQQAESGSAPSDDADQIIFKTPLSACKNIFDPPEFVRNLKSYTPGAPCSQYNKCLGCDNVIITSAHLPEIFAMERDYMLLIDRSRVMDTPYGHVVSENLELINEIVNPDRSDFSFEELERGKRLSEFVETTILVDGVAI